MAISIDPATKVITVPQADCTFVSGTFYRLPSETKFRFDVNALMDDEDRIWLQPPISHNTEVTVAGVTYARFIEIINGFSITFTPDTPWTVEITESNNNLHDVAAGILNQNQVQVITTNAAGLISVSSGSGLDAGQDTKLTRIHTLLDVIEGALDHQEVMRLLLASAAGKLSGAAGTNVLIRDSADSKDRINATVDADGNRTAVTLDAT